MTMLITFYCNPGSTLFKQLHSQLWKVGENVPNLRRLFNICIKIFSAMQAKEQYGRLSGIPVSYLLCGMSKGK